MATKVAEEEPATTETEGGTVSSRLLLASATTTPLPPAGAAWLKVTVQVVMAPKMMRPGLQVSEDGTSGAVADGVAGATNMIMAVCDDPFRLAVNVEL